MKTWTIKNHEQILKNTLWTALLAFLSDFEHGVEQTLKKYKINIFDVFVADVSNKT